MSDHPSRSEIADSVQSLANASVLVIGDAMLDRYVHGSIFRQSTEAPVDILAIDKEEAQPGGSGNVVRNLAALGVAVAFISVVGDDSAGSDLTGLIGGQPGIEPWLLVQGGRTTTLKTRFVADGRHLLRTDREQTDPIHPKIAERLVRIAEDAMAATSVTVLSDYDKGVLSGDIPAQLLEAARRVGRPSIVDPRGPNFARYAGADIVMPNRPELSAATGMPVGSEAEIVAAAHALRDAHRFGAVVVTRSNDGITLVDGDGVRHFPAEAPAIVDRSGAGDTALAALAAGVAAKLPLPIAVRIANLAAGLSVGRPGHAVVHEDDILSMLKAEC